MMDPQTNTQGIDQDIAYLAGSLNGAAELLARASTSMSATATATAGAVANVPDGPPVSRREYAEGVARTWATFAAMLEEMRTEAARSAEELRQRLSPEDRAALEVLEARVVAL